MKNIINRILFVITILILTLLELFWLASIFALFLIIYFLVLKLISLTKSSIINKILKSLFFILFMFSIGVISKTLIFGVFVIPSSSMENTLYPKDVILVNKIKYGPSLPRSPYDIPWINLFYYLKDNSKEVLTKKLWEAKRLAGTSTIKQGDVIVFKKFKKDVVFVKRCSAISGDTLKIVDGEIYTNSKLYHEPNHIRNNYAFKVKRPKAFYNILDSLNINTFFYALKSGGYWKEAEFSYLEIKKLEYLNSIDSIRKKTDISLLDQKNVFPWYKDRKWTLDNYGAIIIPKAGMQIQLTDDTFKLYKSIIKKYENSIIKKKEAAFLIDGKIVTSYTFKKNYYFMMGDNRKQSQDSRYFGFLPEEKIIGKVQCVLYSNYQDKFQWNRFFKSVN